MSLKLELIIYIRKIKVRFHEILFHKSGLLTLGNNSEITAYDLARIRINLNLIKLYFIIFDLNLLNRIIDFNDSNADYTS